MPALTLLAIAFSVGIAVEESLLLPRLAWLVLAAASLALLVLAWKRGRLLGLAALLHALALGALDAHLAWPRAPDGLLGGAPWRVTARVLDEPERALGQVHVLLRLETVEREGGVRDVDGRAWLKLGGDPVEPLLPGDRVTFRATLQAPHGFVEPDTPDPARRLAERGVIAVAGLPSSDGLARRVDAPPRGDPPLVRAIASLRARLLATIRASLDGDRRALVESLVLGERGEVSRELDDAFRVAGVSHVLSVSGLHLAIAAFLFYVGLRRLLARVEPLARRVPVRRLAALASLPATLVYTLLTGAQLATVRSCVVAWVFLVGVILDRPATGWTALGTAALVLLGASPLSLYDPSFQLSFVAAAGLLALAPRLLDALQPERLRGPGLGRRIARFALGIVATSLAATAATAPLAAWHFAQVAPAGLVANVAVVPLAELWVLPVGLAACVASLASTIAGRALLWLAGGGAAAMAAVVRGFAALPHLPSLGVVRAPTLVEAAAWYGALIALAVAGRRGLRVALACVALLAASIGWHALAPRALPRLRVDFLDVGQGDSCLVELPDGKTLLVDGGGSFDPGFDPGAQVLVPWLERHGVRRLDVIVLTHPHPDHANGLASVAARFPVGEIWTNGVPSSLPALERLRAIAAERAIPMVRPHMLDEAGARVDVLHPIVDGVVRAPPAWSENDGSIVLRVTWAGRAILLAGDVEARAEARLLSTEGLGHVDVVKAPHHGSRTSSTPALVAATRPSIVVFSVGAGNRWGFPAREVDARWRGVGARTFRTDRDGAVTVTVDARGRIEAEGAHRERPQ